MTGCKAINAKRHPARFPARLPEFFIKFLTEPGDRVLDIFAGSNTTGYVAENLQREWLSFDSEIDYVAPSAFRFLEKGTEAETLSEIHHRIKTCHEAVIMQDYQKQLHLYTRRTQNVL